MGNSRSFTTTFNTVNRKLEQALKANGYRSASKRRELMMLAAMGRPADLPEQARISLALRRIVGSA